MRTFIVQYREHNRSDEVAIFWIYQIEFAALIMAYFTQINILLLDLVRKGIQGMTLMEGRHQLDSQ